MNVTLTTTPDYLNPCPIFFLPWSPLFPLQDVFLRSLTKTNSTICIFLTTTNFIFHEKNTFHKSFADLICVTWHAITLPWGSLWWIASSHWGVDHSVPCAMAIRLRAVPCRSWRQAWRKSLRFKPRGRVSVRGRLAVDRPALCPLQARVCVWNDRCDTLCSCPALLLFQLLAGDPPSDVLAPVHWVTACDIVIVCSGWWRPRSVRSFRFLLLGN